MPAKLSNRNLKKTFAIHGFLCLAAIILLYLVIGGISPAMLRHRAIAEALLAGQNWGRQALVGSLEYPPLPTLLLLIFDGPLKILSLDGARLLCAVAQVFCISRMLRLLQTFGRRGEMLIIFLLPLSMVIFWRDAFLFTSADPGWVTAAVYVGFFCSLSRWQHKQDLRHLVSASFMLGLLTLCGIGGILLALLSLPVALHGIKRITANEEKFRGLPTLMGLPVIYCLALLLLWNWLVMDDTLFFARDFWARASSLHLSSFGNAAHKYLLFFYLLAVMVLLIVSFFSDQSLSAHLLLPAFLVIPLVFLLCRNMQVHPAGAGAMSGMALVLFFLLYSYSNFNTVLSGILAGGGTLALAICGFAAFFEHKSPFLDVQAEIPEREQLVAYIDQFWPDSRIMLYGLPLACSYPDPLEKRFVARLDYQEADFLRQAADEQMHLLLPPPDGRFYAPGKTVFSDIYMSGRSWLLLEQQYPDGWQLWRCVIAPEGESKLDILR